jgi:hypothetical protein
MPIDPKIAELADNGGIEDYDSPEFEELVANFLAVAPQAPAEPVGAGHTHQH